MFEHLHDAHDASDAAPGPCADDAEPRPCADDSEFLSARQVDTALRRALSELQRAEQRAVSFFAQIVRRKLYRELGYATIHQYAGEALGFSTNRTSRFLRLTEDLERLPRLREAVETGEVGWTKAREVVKVASPSTEEQWVAAAKRVGRRELEGLVARARKLRAAKRRSNPGQGTLAVTASSPESGTEVDLLAAVAAPGGVGDAGGTALVDDAPVDVVFRLDPLQLVRYEAMMERIRQARIVPPATSREEVLLAALDQLLLAGATEDGADGSSGRGSGSDGEPRGEDPGAGSSLLPRGNSACTYKVMICKCDTCRRGFVRTARGEKAIAPAELAAISCDAVVAQPGERQRATIRPSVRSAVLARDRQRCQAPGCGRTRFLQMHHIVAREAGGSHRPENLVTLCSSCHRLWHERGLGARRAPG